MMKKLIYMVCAALAVMPAACGSHKTETAAEPGLKDIFGDRFLVGAAVNGRQMAGLDSAGAEAILRHFNSIVAENEMKCEVIHPEQGRYDWAGADSLVDFGERNGMAVIGHCLIWHSQCAPWFLVDAEGKYVSADTLKARMREHIHTVVGRYKGRVKGWDVVNEAILEDGSYRRSGFYEILGEEFIPLAFQYAHEADPDAELYYNDYGMNHPGRRDAVVRLARDLKARGLRIDAIGMQSHLGMDYPDFGEYEAAMDSFAATGCKLMITELDMSALPTVQQGANISDTVAYARELNPYPEALPDSVAELWNRRMEQAMDLYVKHSDVITRVNAWGVCDGDSWRNSWPVEGRHDYPLLLDRDYKLKPFLNKYLD